MNSAGTGNDFEDPKMPLTEHLRELRRRMIYTFIGLGLAFGVTWTFSFEILDFVKDPLLAHLPRKAGRSCITTPSSHLFSPISRRRFTGRCS